MCGLSDLQGNKTEFPFFPNLVNLGILDKMTKNNLHFSAQAQSNREFE